MHTQLQCMQVCIEKYVQYMHTYMHALKLCMHCIHEYIASICSPTQMHSCAKTHLYSMPDKIHKAKDDLYTMSTGASQIGDKPYR